MKTSTVFVFPLREVPNGKRPVEFLQEVNKMNQLRILRTGHRQMMNCIKLGRYEEAAYRSNVLAGILRVWQKQQDQLKLNQSNQKRKLTKPPDSFCLSSIGRRGENTHEESTH